LRMRGVIKGLETAQSDLRLVVYAVTEPKSTADEFLIVTL
jgi:hypothetical protein